MAPLRNKETLFATEVCDTNDCVAVTKIKNRIVLFTETPLCTKASGTTIDSTCNNWSNRVSLLLRQGEGKELRSRGDQQVLLTFYFVRNRPVVHDLVKAHMPERTA